MSRTRMNAPHTRTEVTQLRRAQVLKVHGSDGREVVLDSLLGSGGEGEVWSVHGDAQTCAKILAAPLRGAKRSRIAAMVDSQPRRRGGHLQFAWPTEMLWSKDNQSEFVGFLMPRLPEGTIPGIELATSTIGHKSLSAARNQFAWKLNAAANLCEAFASLHTQGHRVGDVREVNLVFSTEGEVTFLDCDSFQIGNAFVCPMMGVEEYQPPECIVAGAAVPTDRIYTDCWALAVLVWRILHQGFLPFQHRGIESYPDAVLQGRSPLLDKRWRPVPGCPATEQILPEAVLELFRQTFGVGRSNPAQRPEPGAFAEALRSVGCSGFHHCQRNPKHQWPKPSWLARQGTCPWCEAKGITSPTEVTRMETIRQRQVALETEQVRPVRVAAPRQVNAKTPTRWGRILRWGIFAILAIMLIRWANTVDASRPRPATVATASFAPDLRVNSLGLHLRAEPFAGSASLRALGPGEAVQETERQGRWIRVRDSSGLHGWANGRFLSPIQSP